MMLNSSIRADDSTLQIVLFWCRENYYEVKFLRYSSLTLTVAFIEFKWISGYDTNTV